jgi:hypothetical protein
VGVAALRDANFLGAQERGARAQVFGIVVGVSAAVIRDWRHSAGVAVFGVLVFVGFLAHRYGDLTGDASAWRYTVLIAFAACLGRTVRRANPQSAAGGPGHGPHAPAATSPVRAEPPGHGGNR